MLVKFGTQLSYIYMLANISGFFLGILGFATPFELGKIDGVFQCTTSSL